jgi:hypothetical protein
MDERLCDGNAHHDLRVGLSKAHEVCHRHLTHRHADTVGFHVEADKQHEGITAGDPVRVSICVRVRLWVCAAVSLWTCSGSSAGLRGRATTSKQPKRLNL